MTQALDVVENSSTLSQVLLNAVNLIRKSDTDTLCAISMAIASRCPDIQNDLPQNLYDTLENGPYGRDHLQAFDRTLLRRFQSKHLYDNGFKAKGPTSSPA